MNLERPHPVAALRLALSGALAMACLMGFGRFSYTPILPGMMADLKLSAGDAGSIAAANFAGYLLGAILASGRWAAGRERAVALTALISTALLLFAMAMAESIPAFMVIRFLAGVASAFGMVFTTSIVLGAALGNSRVQAGHFSGVGAGIALSALVSFVAVAASGEGPAPWRGEWIAGGVVVLLASLVVFRLLPRPAAGRDEAPPEPPLRWTLPLVRLCLSYGLFGLGYVVAATFLVVMARAGTGGHTVEFLSWLVTGFAAMASLFLWQPAVRRLGLPAAYRASLVIEAAGAAVMVLLPGVSAPLIGGLLFGSTFVVATAYALQIGRMLQPRSQRRVMGLMTAAFGVGQIVGPVIAGAIVDRTGTYVVASLLSAAMLGLGGLIAPGRIKSSQD
jgi:MFS family permease